MCSVGRKTLQNFFLFLLRKFGSSRLKVAAGQAITKSLVLRRTMATDAPQLGCVQCDAATVLIVHARLLFLTIVLKPARVCLINLPQPPSSTASWIVYSSFIHLGAFVYFIYVTHLQPLDVITGSSNRSSQVPLSSSVFSASRVGGEVGDQRTRA